VKSSEVQSSVSRQRGIPALKIFPNYTAFLKSNEAGRQASINLR